MTLSSEQRDEIDALIQAHGSTRKLSSGQKWDVAVLVASFLGGAVSLLGVAGYFVVVNAANISAERVAAVVAPSEVADVLGARDEFLERIRDETVAIPTGAVIAFDFEGGCPEGWSDFSLARGRMILGATPPNQESLGLTRRDFLERGGEEFHTLTISQIPPHSHQSEVLHGRVPGQGESAWQAFLSTARSGTPDGLTELPSAIVGGGQPHNNMPPYIALYVCKKD